MLRPLHFELANEIITPSIAAEEATLVNAHLDHHGVLGKPSTHSAHPAVPANDDYNRERAIVRLTKRLSRVKNQSRRTFSRNPSEFLNAVRAHHKTKKAADHLGQQRSARKQGKAFRNNPWKFSMSVCEDHGLPQPTFSMQMCLEFFQSTYSSDHVSYTKLPDWVNEVNANPRHPSGF